MPATNGRTRNGSQQTFIPASPDERRSSRQNIEDLVERVPPHDIMAERGVLTSLMLDPDRIDDIFGRLNCDDFYNDAHRQIFIAITNLHAAGRKIDVALLVDRLERSNMLAFVGGVAYLMELFDGYVGHSQNLEYFADIVRERAMRRRLITTCAKTVNEAFCLTIDARKLATETETGVADCAAARDTDSHCAFGDAATSLINRKKAEKANPKKEKRGIKTSLYKLGEILGLYESQQVTLVAARTSVGKTAFVTSQVAEWLTDTDYVGHFCSLEMNRLELAERIICAACDIDLTTFRNGNATAEQMLRYQQWRDDNQIARRLFIDDAPERYVNEIFAMARRTKRMAGRLDYLIIDYVQMIEWDGDKYAKRHEQVSKISRAIKIGARSLDCPVIMLCQLNREAAEGRPKLSHLRESGSLEQDADKVVFIDRQTEGEDAATALATLIVAKNRFGKTGECKAAFFGGFQRFSNLAEDMAF